VETDGTSLVRAGRFEYLDGLRGLAALAVVNHHFICGFAPWIFPNPALYQLLFIAGPLVILRNGNFAVYVFFALSGFVIANSAAGKGYVLPVRLLTRYLRLAVPLTCSLLFAFALLSLFPTSRLELIRTIPHLWLHAVYLDDLPGVTRALSDGVFNVFHTGKSGFNNVVWTMKTELFGSCALYVLYRYCPARGRIPALLAALAAVAIWERIYLGFPLGALLREAYIRGYLRRSAWSWVALAAGIAVGSVCTYPDVGGLFLPDSALAVFQQNEILVDGLGAAALVLAILTLAPLQVALSRMVPRFLGRISFALYLVHVPIVYTVIAWMYLTLPIGGYSKLAVLFIALVALSLVAAWALTVAVDEPLMKGLRKLNAWRPVPRAIPDSAA
jgi:peptidoglycan/LPS O-acetylase OafA/YrhL